MGVPVVTVQCDGTKLDPRHEMLSVEVVRELNRIPEATLTLLDGDVAARTFHVSSLALFLPGRKVEILARYEGQTRDRKLFAGQVVRHSVESTSEGTRLRVELKDSAFKLTRTRNSTVHRKKSDDEAIATLLKNAGIQEHNLTKSSVTHEELVQYQATDWDFIVSRADVLGQAVDVHLGKVSTKPLALGKPEMKIEHGLGELLDLSLELDALDQWDSMEATSWDRKELKAARTKKAKEPEVKVGNVDAASIALELGAKKSTLRHAGVLLPDELQRWADARMLRSRLSLLRGRIVVPGNASLAPLQTVQIGGVGDRFNGKALVSAVSQRIDDQGWRTELRLGLSPEPFARQPDISDVLAGGLLPPAQGLVVGTVAAFKEDPDGEHRIQVSLPSLDAKQGFLWARLARPDAGPKRGFNFWPEVGDEVVLGFVDGDPRQPVVLGALFSKKNAAPGPGESPNEDNHKRAIVSRKGSRIVFDDEKPSITIETTPDGDTAKEYENQVIIDQKEKTITLKDQHKNVIVMDKDGIRITSAKDLTIKAEGNVAIEGKEFSAKGQTKAAIEGAEFNAKAQGKAAIQGASVELG